MREFSEFELARDDLILRRHRSTGSVVGGFLDCHDIEPVPVFAAGAWPGGMIDAATASELISRLGEEVEACGPLDGILINLHGAMVAEGRPDMELDAVTRIRQVVGSTPVVCVLDLHGLPSPQLIAAVDAAIAYDTYPHVDMRERGREAAELLVRSLRGEKLVSAVAKLPLLTTPLAQATEAEPMQSLLRQARTMADDAGLTRISLLPGFPYSDVTRAGFSVVGVAEASRRDRLVGAVDAIAGLVEERAHEFAIERPDAATAVRRALDADRHPVVIADIADNVGGGGAGDGTALLRELIAQGARGSVVTIADPVAASEATAVGVGRRLQTRLGGRLDRMHGDPVEVEAKVVRVSDGDYRSAGSYMTGQSFNLGATAHLQVDGIDVVVTERAVPPFHREQITHLGIDPSAATVITAKGAIAWRSAFGDVAAEVIEADTPGVTPLDPSVLPRRTTPARIHAAQDTQASEVKEDAEEAVP